MTLGNGYQMQTTFWDDFSIADNFGIKAIKDTYERAFGEWSENYIYLTELVIVLNHKIWQWYERDKEIAKLYNDLWHKADNYALDSLSEDELTFFLAVTD